MFRKLVLPATLLGILCFLIGFLGKYHWLLNIFSHFRVQYLFYFLVLFTLSIVFRKRNIAIVNGVFVLLILSSLLKFYWPNNVPRSTSSVLKIASINLLSSNHEYAQVKEFIHTAQPDVVVVLELTTTWKDQLRDLYDEYSYQHMQPQGNNFGIGMLSKIPLRNAYSVLLSEAQAPTVVANVNLDDQLVTIIGTHPMSPGGFENYQWRNKQLTNLGKLASQQTNPVVLVGDVNCTSFSPNFSRLTEETKLRDSRLGYGLQPSWPAYIFPLQIPIDHCLISEDVVVLAREMGPNVGSDHLPVIVTVGIAN